MTDNNRIFFQEDAFSNWMEDGIVAERETEATAVEQASSPVANPVHESPGEQVAQPKMVPVSATTPVGEGSAAPQRRPARATKRVPLRMEDLRLHDWIHGTGEVISQVPEEEEDHLGL